MAADRPTAPQGAETGTGRDHGTGRSSDATRPARRRTRTRTRVAIAAVLAFVSLALVTGANVVQGQRGGTSAYIALYQDGLGTGADGLVRSLPAGRDAEYLPGSRVVVPERATDLPAARLQAARERRWLADGIVPGDGTQWEELVAGALLDLHALQGGRGTSGPVADTDERVVLAAWHPRWQYVWPRDTAFVAVALARTGHVEDAADALVAVGEAQADDGLLAPRYLPDLSGTPDDRPPQGDGPGWLLWSAGLTVEACEEQAAGGGEEAGTDDGAGADADAGTGDPPDCAAVLEALAPMIEHSVTAVLAATDGPSPLPEPTSDYWEIPEDRLPLGAVAPQWAGLQAAPALLEALGEDELADRARGRADALGQALEASYGVRGWTRYASWDPTAAVRGVSGRDASTSFLLPPFTEAPPAGAEAAWLVSAGEMARPAGGLAPGSSWRRDGISWTPQTSLYAWVAAVNDRPDDAVRRLAWVEAHRTASGAIPEKVLADGSPAAVAPLAWSAANVVLAVLALEEAGQLPAEIPTAEGQGSAD
ncbi:glycoside hydrolase family 15 [Georgenia sp. Z1344]|uniref:glycoside hydrolase family 15 n=1 Tax=Georgenia sp. Z1344 TaxID=3416706 RepID=UPI003CF3C61E